MKKRNKGKRTPGRSITIPGKGTSDARSDLHLSAESRTLFLPLYGKAEMSQRGLFLHDQKAEDIIRSLRSDFEKMDRPKQSKWLSMFLALRASIYDDIVLDSLRKNPDLTVIHLGCGLDSRVVRAGKKVRRWFDVDLPEVIVLRKRYYPQTPGYSMIGCPATDSQWIQQVEKTCGRLKTAPVLILAEGLSMYLSRQEIETLLAKMAAAFPGALLVLDAYSHRAVRYSKVKNPINQMSAAVSWGMDDPEELLALHTALRFDQAYPIRDTKNQLSGLEKWIFQTLYSGKMAQSLYRIYQFHFEG